jgi:hypothetical protein
MTENEEIIKLLKQNNERLDKISNLLEIMGNMIGAKLDKVIADTHETSENVRRFA